MVRDTGVGETKSGGEKRVEKKIRCCSNKKVIGVSMAGGKVWKACECKIPKALLYAL